MITRRLASTVSVPPGNKSPRKIVLVGAGFLGKSSSSYTPYTQKKKKKGSKKKKKKGEKAKKGRKANMGL